MIPDPHALTDLGESARYDLDQSATTDLLLNSISWNGNPISTAPFDRDLELAVLDRDGVHALVFPCRRILGSWINAETKQRIDVWPTHWREWKAVS